MQTPVASNTALAIAAATGRLDASPAPDGAIWAVDQHDVDLFPRLGDVEDRIGPPIDAGDILLVELDLLPQRAAGGLDDVILDGVAQPVRIDDLAAIVGDRELARPDLSCGTVDLDFGDNRDAAGAALRIGDAAAGHLVAGLILARRRSEIAIRRLDRS